MLRRISQARSHAGSRFARLATGGGILVIGTAIITGLSAPATYAAGDAARGAPGTSTVTLAGGGLEDSTCGLKLTSAIKINAPTHDYKVTSSYTYDFLHTAYDKFNARQLYGPNGMSYKTFQSALCTVGGGESRDKWKIWFIGDAATLAMPKKYTVGHIWGTGRDSGGGSYSGDVGADGKFSGYPYPTRFNSNRVNTFYLSPHFWPWDGSAGYQGNASVALAEWPMGMPVRFRWKTWAQAEVWCPDILGCR